MSVASFKAQLTNWRAWEINPIVIKELRQAVRSWSVTGMLMTFLVVLFIASIGFLVAQNGEMNQNLELGGTMFSVFMVILAIASIFFIPLYIGIRVGVERQQGNLDLLYVSTLSPARIILGKFLCGLYMAVLFFSACMPFMAFTNLLRGVDLPTVFFLLFCLFMIVCATNMFAIFMACLPLSRAFKALLVVYGTVQSIAIIFSLVGMSFRLLNAGVGAMMGDRSFWLGVLTALVVGAAVIGLFYVLAVALISPLSANRALPVRVYITVMWLVMGLLAFGWAVHIKNTLVIFTWVDGTFVLMMYALIVVIANTDELSRRVRRKIPRSRLKRLFALLFFNGAAGGLLWVAVMLAATFLLMGLALALSPTRSLYTENWYWFLPTAAYAFAYALLGLFIHRKFFPGVTGRLAALTAVLLAGAWAVTPSIVLFFLNQLSWRSPQVLQLGNIFNLFNLPDDHRRDYHAIFSSGWLVVMLLLNAKWFIRQLRNFQPPPAPENVPPVID